VPIRLVDDAGPRMSKAAPLREVDTDSENGPLVFSDLCVRISIWGIRVGAVQAPSSPSPAATPVNMDPPLLADADRPLSVVENVEGRPDRRLAGRGEDRLRRDARSTGDRARRRLGTAPLPSTEKPIGAMMLKAIDELRGATTDIVESSRAPETKLEPRSRSQGLIGGPQ
jgi:hypothetical protein